MIPYDTLDMLVIVTIHSELHSMAKPDRDMTPARIRAIRERLDLTQEEAGKLLGGGRGRSRSTSRGA